MHTTKLTPEVKDGLEREKTDSGLRVGSFPGFLREGDYRDRAELRTAEREKRLVGNQGREGRETTPPPRPVPCLTPSLVVFFHPSGLTVHQLVQVLLLTPPALVCGEKGGGEGLIKPRLALNSWSCSCCPSAEILVMHHRCQALSESPVPWC